jgi:NADH-quinone oxidoreductase subunit M
MDYLTFSDFPWLSLLIAAPLLGMGLVWLAGPLRLSERATALGAAAWALVPLGIALYVWARFEPGRVAAGQGVVQFVELLPWVRAIRVEYFLGVDGISLPLVLLTTLMTPVALLAPAPAPDRLRAYIALIFLLEAAMLGFFLALNFFFFFIFWEFSLVPAFFLIQAWGRNPARRRGAALKFFIFTLTGSLGMLLLFQFFYVATRAAGAPTFDLITLGRLGQGLPVVVVNDAGQAVRLTSTLQQIIFEYVDTHGVSDVLGRFPLLYTSIAFWAMFIAFAVKLGVWPFHIWLPDAYAEAPTAGSILLAAVMSKMGAYGMLRIMLPLLPDAAQFFAPAVAALALVSIVAGAFGALAQTGGDIKRLIAYTSINHMGYVALAVAAVAALGAAGAESRAIALNGAVFQLVAHGLSTGALFLLAGLLAARSGTWQLREWGGLRRVMPTFAGVMGVALFANLGLPGLAGFVGEFFIFRGAWPSLPLYTLLATIGLVVTALALLAMYGQIFHGPLEERWAGLPDMRLASREFLAVAPLLGLAIALGVFPAPLMDVTNRAATALAAAFLTR